MKRQWHWGDELPFQMGGTKSPNTGDVCCVGTRPVGTMWIHRRNGVLGASALHTPKKASLNDMGNDIMCCALV